MTFREFLNCLGFVVTAQNLVIPFRFELPALPEVQGKQKKKRFRPQESKTFSKQCGDRVYHRRLCREYENYRKD